MSTIRSATSFLQLYLNLKIRTEDDYIALSDLSALVGRTKEFLLEEAKLRKFEVWFLVPGDVETRRFSIEHILVSQIRFDLDYLNVGRKNFVGFKHLEKTHYMVSVGEKTPMKYLLVSFQDLRWNAKNAFCVFTRGFQDEGIEYEPSKDLEKGIIRGDPRVHDYTDMEYSPSAFITCKKGDESTVLNEDRVVRFEAKNMELFVRPYELQIFIAEIAEEMDHIKTVLLQYLGLENMNFSEFPEKLFYVFVVTYRNVDRTELGCKINRENVENELILFGINNKAADYFSTLIINTKNSAPKKVEKYIKKADKEGEVFFDSLKVMGSFHTFKYFYKKRKEAEAKAKEVAAKAKTDAEAVAKDTKGKVKAEKNKAKKKIIIAKAKAKAEENKAKVEKDKAEEAAKNKIRSTNIADHLIENFNYVDESARGVSSIISGLDNNESWELLSHMYLPDYLKNFD